MNKKSFLSVSLKKDKEFIRDNDAGNVLFLILIAVALFAALSYAVTSSSRNTGNTIDNEKAASYAAAIISDAAGIRSAITRLRISGQCGESELDFSNNIFKKIDGSVINNPNANAPADMHCDVFRSAGGGIIPTVAPVDAFTPPANPSAFTGYGRPGHAGVRATQVRNIGTDGAAGLASANDLQWNINWISREVCLAINKAGNIPNPGGEPPVDIVTG